MEGGRGDGPRLSSNGEIGNAATCRKPGTCAPPAGRPTPAPARPDAPSLAGARTSGRSIPRGRQRAPDAPSLPDAASRPSFPRAASLPRCPLPSLPGCLVAYCLLPIACCLLPRCLLPGFLALIFFYETKPKNRPGAIENAVSSSRTNPIKPIFRAFCTPIEPIFDPGVAWPSAAPPSRRAKQAGGTAKRSAAIPSGPRRPRAALAGSCRPPAMPLRWFVSAACQRPALSVRAEYAKPAGAARRLGNNRT